MASAFRADVYAPLPTTVAPGGELDLDDSKWRWVHCLTIPYEKFSRTDILAPFSRNPYKWIRYAIGVIVGAQGVLSTVQDSLNAVDEDAPLPAETISLYYLVDEVEKQKIFPLDPNIGCSHITSTRTSTRRGEFRKDVAERDGGTCVLTNTPERFCEAAHLLGHNKGDEYISTFTRRRSRDPSGGDVIDEIDDARNGLFLLHGAHIELGINLAFLMTPNFAMTTSDIDPTATATEKRVTSHRFTPPTGNLYADLPTGVKTRMADGDYPPAILFDAVYAAAVLHHFAVRCLKDLVNDTWKEIFYPRKIMTSAEAEHQAIIDERKALQEKEDQQAQDRRSRLKSRYSRRSDTIPDVFDMLMAIPYIMVPPRKLLVLMSEAEGRAEEAERKRLQENVSAWIRGVES